MQSKLSRNLGFTTKEVSEYFEISERQVRRDVEYLRDRLLIPVVYDSEKRRYVVNGEWKDGGNFDAKLILANALLDSFLTKIPVGSFISDEIKTSVREGMSSEARNIVDKVTFRFPSTDLPDYSVFNIVVDTFKKDCCVEIKYSKNMHEYSERIVEPIKLINYNQTWYLFAFDHKNMEERIFHLSRIQSAILSNCDKEYEIDESSIDEKIKKGFGIFIGGDQDKYRIRFYNNAAWRMKSQIWHENQIIEENEDGSIDLIVPSASSIELINKMFEFEGEAIPISPEYFVINYQEKIESLYNSLKK